MRRHQAFALAPVTRPRLGKDLGGAGAVVAHHHFDGGVGHARQRGFHRVVLLAQDRAVVPQVHVPRAGPGVKLTRCRQSVGARCSRGPGREPGASSYTLTRLSLSLGARCSLLAR